MKKLEDLVHSMHPDTVAQDRMNRDLSMFYSQLRDQAEIIKAIQEQLLIEKAEPNNRDRREEKKKQKTSAESASVESENVGLMGQRAKLQSNQQKEVESRPKPKLKDYVLSLIRQYAEGE